MPNAAQFGEAAGIVLVLAFLIYAYDALFGQTKPDRVSWLIWTILGGTLLLSYSSAAGEHTQAIWVLWIQFVGPLVILAISVFRGESAWSWYHLYCLVGAGVSLAILWLFHQPTLALLAALTSDLFGAIPTVVKAIRDPKSENRSGWSLSLLANVINMGAITAWTFAVVAYPAYLLFLTLTMTIVVFWPRKKGL